MVKDVPEGMAAIYGGKIYFGSNATVVISAMTQARGPFGRLLAIVLRNPARARFLYPFLKVGRRLALIFSAGRRFDWAQGNGNCEAFQQPVVNQ